MDNTFDVRRSAFGVGWRTVRMCHLLLMVTGLFVCWSAEPATEQGNAARRTPNAERFPTPNAERSLVPIAETLRSINLEHLAAVPVQHGGRYKPLHTLAMEVSDGISGQITLGKGHTSLSSLLDLVFCHESFQHEAIVLVKHAELARDLAVALPAEERARLIDKRRITPERLADIRVQTELARLGQNTTKTKFINQLRFAAANLDQNNLLENLRLYPLPAGPHADRWRGPAEVAPSFAAALQEFAARALAAGGSMDGFTAPHAGALPPSDSLAGRLGLSAEDLRHVNMGALWPLWQSAGAGRIQSNAIQAISVDPLTASAHGLDASAAHYLEQLRARWLEQGLTEGDCADATQRAVISATLDRATAAWVSFGQGWIAARHGAAAMDLQANADALVVALGELKDHLDRDRAVRGLAALAFDTRLELTYWRWNGFASAAWCFLFAMPFLALGCLGRMRWALWLGLALFALGAGGQTAAFFIRWRLAERIPLANLYESMAAAALLASLVAAMMETVMAVRARKSGQPSVMNGALALAAALFGCIIVMALAFLERHNINAFISPAMPILSEFWMRIHVSCVVASYGLISLGGLMSVVYLLMRTRLAWDDPRSVAWDRTTFAMNAAATVVLWAGLVLGAIWAAESWGRPWGWDPKEVFALLTWVVFIFLIHLRHAVAPQHRGLATALVSLAAFLVMGFNWYFVNVKLAGLHSYA